jgi:hypothetical protein
MILSESLKKVAEIWHKECLELVKPKSEKEIVEKLANLKMPISQDVVEVYSILGGMVDGESDATCFSFWDIDKILDENEPNSELIGFGDFLIHSHLYYFKFRNESVSSIHIWWEEKDIEKIADSFEEFFENYLKNPEKYYLFEREENKKEKKTRIQL